jgi:hypothetical protein
MGVGDVYDRNLDLSETCRNPRGELGDESDEQGESRRGEGQRENDA